MTNKKVTSSRCHCWFKQIVLWPIVILAICGLFSSNNKRRCVFDCLDQDDKMINMLVIGLQLCGPCSFISDQHDNCQIQSRSPSSSQRWGINASNRRDKTTCGFCLVYNQLVNHSYLVSTLKLSDANQLLHQMNIDLRCLHYSWPPPPRTPADLSFSYLHHKPFQVINKHNITLAYFSGF